MCSSTPVPDGLRAAHKRRTRAALSQAAVDIVSTEGIDALTADRIAAAAGVSRRTLFNYFSRVEDVLVASIDDVTRETVAAVVARPAGEPLRESVAAVVDGLLGSPVYAQAFALERAAEASPATRRFLREFGDSQVEALEQGLRDRLGPDVDPVYVAVLAAALVGAMDRVTRLIFSATPEVDPRDPAVVRRLHDGIRRAFDLIFTGFDAGPDPLSPRLSEG